MSSSYKVAVCAIETGDDGKVSKIEVIPLLDCDTWDRASKAAEDWAKISAPVLRDALELGPEAMADARKAARQ